MTDLYTNSHMGSLPNQKNFVCFYTFDCARHSVLGSDLLQLEDLLEKKWELGSGTKWMNCLDKNYERINCCCERVQHGECFKKSDCGHKRWLWSCLCNHNIFVFKVATKGKIELDGIRYSIHILWQGVETWTLEASDLLGISINSFIRHQALTNCVVKMKFCEMFWLHNCFTLQKQLFLDIKEIRQACLFWKIDSDKQAINLYLQMGYSSTRTWVYAATTLLLCWKPWNIWKIRNVPEKLEPLNH